MEYTLTTKAPHIRATDDTASIMNDVSIALIPASVFAVYNFGMYAAAIIAVGILFAVAGEYFWQYFTGKEITVRDGSAVVTGLLVALNMPPAAPLWLTAAASVVAIVVFKQIFGGIGKNFINPAVGVRVLLLLVFTAKMSLFAVDAYTGATPLTVLKRGVSPDLSAMFLGLTSGSIGEVSAAALILGGAYLIIKRVIRWEIPAVFIGSFLAFIAIFSGKGMDMQYLLAQLLGGGLLLGAFFMATDYTTSPLTTWGRVIYAALLGIITALFRLYSAYPEGVSFAILIGNVCVPFLNMIKPRAFGMGKNHGKA